VKIKKWQRKVKAPIREKHQLREKHIVLFVDMFGKKYIIRNINQNNIGYLIDNLC